MIPKLATLAVSATLAASMAAPVTAFAKDGVYTASSVGRNGSINVQVTIKNDAIADVKIVDWSETHPVADLTKTKLIPDIIKYQSVEVDAISGATLSSFAIKDAVSQCLKKAGLDVTKFEKEVPQPALLTDTKTLDADIVIIGAGGAGLSAAVTAAEQGPAAIGCILRRRVFVCLHINPPDTHGIGRRRAVRLPVVRR